MRRYAAVPVLLLAGLVLAGCETSKLAVDATVVVSGRILGVDGSPAAGVTVALERDPSVGEIVGGLVIVPLTLFTACLAEPPPRICRGRDIDHATTTADGRYSFTMTGRRAQTGFGHVVSFSLWTEVAPAAGQLSGAGVRAGFEIQTENLVLPDLQVWQPALTVDAGRVTWGPPATGAGLYQVVVEDAASKHVWAFEGTRSEVRFDPRILEDTAGSLAVSAISNLAAEETGVHVQRGSGRVAYRSAAGAPTSRGRPCTVAPTATAPAARCSMTDGDLTSRLGGPATPATSTTAELPEESATIDLGRAVEVSLVVVRGCACQVERSADGQAWTAVGQSSGYTAVVPSRTGAARYVRVTGPLNELREVSVWEGASPAAAPPSAGSPPAETAVPGALPAPASTPASSRRGPALVALAALLGAAVLTAATAARSRT